MANKPINEGDIIKDGAIESIISDFDKLYNSLKKNSEEMGKFATAMGGVKMPTNTKEFQALIDNMGKLEQTYKTQYKSQEDLLKIDKLRQDARKKKEQADQAELRTAKMREASQKKELTQYQLASRELTQMKNRYKDLAYQKSQGIKLTTDEAKEYRKLGKSVKEADDNLKRIDKSTGDNFRNVGNYKNAVSGLKGALGQLGLVFGGFALAKAGANAILEYETALASFRTIVSDLNDNQFDKFKSKIEDIATTTKKSTIDVAKSFEVIAGLNSSFAETADGLGKVSEATITLSKASGDDLGVSAENLVGIMNQFSLSADQADLAINVLAAGQAVGAASITQLGESYKNVGKVAKDANIDINKSTALLEVLGNYSIVGAEAGTKLRGVILKLQQANLGYASGQFNINDALKEYNEKSDKLVTAKEKDAFASQTLGAENISAGKILASNLPLLDKYTEAVTGTTEAQKAAEINSNTLANRWEELKNSLVNVITTTDSVGGGVDLLKNSLKFLADNIGTVIKVLARLVLMYASYKAIMKSIEIARHVKELGGLKSMITDSAESMKDASKEAKGFGNALKGIGGAIAIMIFFEIAKALYDVASGANAAADAMARYEKQVAKATKDSEKYVMIIKETEKQRIAELNELLKAGKITQKQYDELIAKAKKATESELKNNVKIVTSRRAMYESQRDRVKQIDAELKIENEKLKNSSGKDNFKDDRRKKELLKELLGIQKELGIEGNKFLGIQKDADIPQILAQLNANISGANVRLTQYNGTLKDNVDDTKDFNVQTNDASKGVSGFGKSAKQTAKEIIDYTKAVRDLNDEMLQGSDEETTKFLRASAKLQNERDDAIAKINEDTDLGKDQIKKDEYLIAIGKKYTADLKALDEERIKSKQERIKKEFDDEVQLQSDAYSTAIARKETDARIAELTNYLQLKNAILNNDKLSEEEKNKQLEKLEKEHAKRMLAIRITALKSQLEAQFAIQTKIDEEYGNDSEESKTNQDKTNAVTEELLNTQNEFDKSDGEEPETKAEKVKKAVIKVADYLNKLMEFVKDKINAVFDQLIESQNRLIDKSKDMISYLQASAVAGNVQAKESILAEEKAIEDAQKRIEKLQKRKQRLELISGGINSFNQKVASGKNGLQALAETGAEMTGLVALLSALPSFAVGADRLSNDGQNVDGQGGFLAINHKDERILPAENNRIIGFNKTNKEITQIMDYYNKGLLTTANAPIVIPIQNDNSEILRSIDNGFSKINNWNMSIEELFNTMTIIVEKKKNGDTFLSKKSFKL